MSTKRRGRRALPRIGTIAVLTTLFTSMLAVPLATTASAALTGPGYPPPGDVAWSGSPGEATEGKAGGRTWQYQSFDLARFSHLYWGPSSASMPKLALDGAIDAPGETLTFSPSSSNLPAGIAVYTGTAAIRIASGGGYNTETLQTRMTLKAMEWDGSARALVDAASVGAPASVGGVVDVAGDYKVNFLFEALRSGVWTPAVTLYNSLQTDPTKSTKTSFSGAFYWNQIPLAGDTVVTTSEDTAVDFALDASDDDGNALTYSLLTLPATGTLEGTAPNFTFTPNANVNGTDSLTFQVNDGTVDSRIATVSIEIAAVNDVPVAVDGSAATSEDTPVEIVLVGEDPVEGDPVTFTIVDQPVAGSLSGTGPVQIYTPNPNFNGVDQFTFSVSDGTDESNVATISLTIDGVNDAPVAADDSGSTKQYTPVTIDVLSNDTDVELNTLTVSAVAQPSTGAVTINNDGTLTFRPNPTFKGATSFDYTVDDGLGGTDTGTVSIIEIGCGEDGLKALDGTPAEGGASGTIDSTVEPLIGGVDEGLAETVHDTNCGVVVPLEQTIDGE